MRLSWDVIRCLEKVEEKIKNRNRNMGSLLAVEGVRKLSGPCFATLLFSIFVNGLEGGGIAR